MSLNRNVTKQIKLCAVLAGVLVAVAACSSRTSTCDACASTSRQVSNETTGSIPAQGATAPAPAAPPRIAKPATVQAAQRPHVVIARRYDEPHRASASLRRSNTCDVTGSIPHSPRVTRVTEHTILPGETLHSIARRYGTSVTELASYNVIRQSERINAGDTILIPSIHRL